MPKVEITQKTLTKARADAVPGARRYDVTDARARGLVLRVGPRGARWGWRGERGDVGYRLDLGPVEAWSIAEARSIAEEATVHLRSGSGIPDERWLAQRRRALGHAVEPEATPPRPKTWTGVQARGEYLAEIARSRRPDTHTDYSAILHAPELAAVLRRPMAEVTVDEVQDIVDATHRTGRERRSEKIATVVKLFWKWAAKPGNRVRSGVGSGVMAELGAPERTPRRADDDDAPGTYVPSILEVGRIVAIARAGVLDPLVSCAIELLAFTAQRRLPVASARIGQFRPDPDDETVGYWVMPPSHRKTAEKRQDRSNHVVPLTKEAWRIVQRALEARKAVLADGRESDYLFPQRRPKRAGGPLTHLSTSTLTRTFLVMPGVEASPHDLRRGFGTHVQELRDIPRSEVQRILDHNEGIPSSDVTRRYECLDRRNLKWPTVQAWSDLVEGATHQASKLDPLLIDPELLKRIIAQARYGFDKSCEQD